MGLAVVRSLFRTSLICCWKGPPRASPGAPRRVPSRAGPCPSASALRTQSLTVLVQGTFLVKQCPPEAGSPPGCCGTGPLLCRTVLVSRAGGLLPPLPATPLPPGLRHLQRQMHGPGVPHSCAGSCEQERGHQSPVASCGGCGGGTLERIRSSPAQGLIFCACGSSPCSVTPPGTCARGGGAALSPGELEPFGVAAANALSSHAPAHLPCTSRAPSPGRGTGSCRWEPPARPAGAWGHQEHGLSRPLLVRAPSRCCPHLPPYARVPACLPMPVSPLASPCPQQGQLLSFVQFAWLGVVHVGRNMQGTAVSGSVMLRSCSAR